MCLFFTIESPGYLAWAAYCPTLRDIQIFYSFKKLLNIQRLKTTINAPTFCHPLLEMRYWKRLLWLLVFLWKWGFDLQFSQSFPNILVYIWDLVNHTCPDFCHSVFLSLASYLFLAPAASLDSVSYFRHIYHNLITSTFTNILICLKLSDNFFSSICAADHCNKVKLKPTVHSLHLAWNWLLQLEVCLVFIQQYELV